MPTSSASSSARRYPGWEMTCVRSQYRCGGYSRQCSSGRARCTAHDCPRLGAVCGDTRQTGHRHGYSTRRKFQSRNSATSPCRDTDFRSSNRMCTSWHLLHCLRSAQETSNVAALPRAPVRRSFAWASAEQSASQRQRVPLESVKVASTPPRRCEYADSW